MSSYSAFGPGKVILLGEHSVVYGHTALAAPLSWGVTARATSASRSQLALPAIVKGKGRALLQNAFERAASLAGKPKVRVTLESDLPVSMGLGSSGAVAVACARVLLQAAGQRATPKDVLRVALEMERQFHGTPSGVDHTCSALGQCIAYRRVSPSAPPKVKVLESPKPVKLLVAIAGNRGPTGETVGQLRERQALWPKRYARLFREMGKLAEDGARSLKAGDLRGLGDAMNANHGLLSAVGVSSLALDTMVHRLRGFGAWGAKLTGAGGSGGAVIALFPEPEPVVARLLKEGVTCFASQVAGPRAL
ncbi:MAG: mevalonate kinase [Myxococcaceae bacterium]